MINTHETTELIDVNHPRAIPKTTSKRPNILIFTFPLCFLLLFVVYMIAKSPFQSLKATRKCAIIIAVLSRRLERVPPFTKIPFC